MNAQPKILLFSWNPHHLEESGLSYSLHHLPAEFVVVTPSEVHDAIREMANPATVACLFVVTREAFQDSTFTDSVRACLNQLSTRKEFRLFVHLTGITKSDVLASANSNSAAADLLDSVHIGESSEEAECGRLIKNIGAHLRQLPEILDYLKYERCKAIAGDLSSLLNFAFLVVLGYGLWRLGAHRQDTLEGSFLPWILATIGAICYLSFLSICSFGSNLGSGNILRLGMAMFPLWIVSTIPSSKLVANWQYMLVGFGAGILLDWGRRMRAMASRVDVPIFSPEEWRDSDESELPKNALKYSNSVDRYILESQSLPLAGHRRWQMLTNAPVLGSEPRVFISYSRSSQWGSTTARSLHEEIKAIGITSFLDADGIAEGTSWRHKLEEAIGKANVFIAVQDATTASRHWPSAELNAAMQSQAYCGLPSIIIVRDSTLEIQNSKSAHLLNRLVTQSGAVDPLLLRVINFKPGTPNNLARGLKIFNTPCVINPELSTLLYAFLIPLRIALAAIGSISPAITIAVLLVGSVLRHFGFKIEDWVFAHNLSATSMIVSAFFLGFIIRLVFACRFELQIKDAPFIFWGHILAALALLWAENNLIRRETSLAVFAATIVAGFGFILACDFISNSLPRSRDYRPPPM